MKRQSTKNAPDEKAIPRYVFYPRNLAISELADPDKVPAQTDTQSGIREGRKTGYYTESDGFLFDLLLFCKTQKKDAVTMDFGSDFSIYYGRMTLSDAEIRQGFSGYGLLPQLAVKDYFMRHSDRFKANYIIGEQTGKGDKNKKYYKAMPVKLKVKAQEKTEAPGDSKVPGKSTLTGVLDYPEILFGPSHFKAPSFLQAKIKNVHIQDQKRVDSGDIPEEDRLFYEKDKNIKITETMVRKFFLYIGTKDPWTKRTCKICIDLKDLYRVIKPSMLFPDGRFRSLTKAQEIFLRLVRIFNAVVMMERSDMLKTIEEPSKTSQEKYEIMLRKIKRVYIKPAAAIRGRK